MLPRRDRRRMERIKKRAMKALEKGQTHVVNAHFTMTLRHGVRLVRNGQIVAEYGEVPNEREDN